MDIYNDYCLYIKFYSNLFNNIEIGLKADQKYETSRSRRNRFVKASNLFGSNKYESRVKLNTTFNKFDNVISDEEIQKYGEKIWKEAHKKSFKQPKIISQTFLQ